MDQLTQPTDEQLLEVRRLADLWRNHGLDKFARELRTMRDQLDWQWLPRKPTQWFNRTAGNILAPYSYYFHQRARHIQMLEGSFAFWIWRSGLCEKLGHARYEGLTLPPDHAFWTRNWPPLDPECSCSVGGAGSAAGVARMGGDPAIKLPDDWELFPISFGADVLDFRALVAGAIERARAEPT